MFKKTDKEKLALITKWSEIFYDNTETFEGEIALCLAYLWPAMVNDNVIEVDRDSPLVLLINNLHRQRAITLDDFQEISDYIEIVEKELSING
jgi:hypothetical protein